MQRTAIGALLGLSLYGFTGRPAVAQVAPGSNAEQLQRIDRLQELEQLQLDTRLRVSEVANWIEYHVLPKRAKRGRG